MSPPMSIGALPQWLQRAVRNSKDCACAGVSVRLIVDDLEGDVERPELAALRQYHCQFARRKPAIERRRTKPWVFKLDGDLDRPLVADWARSPTAAYWHSSPHI